MIGYDADSSPQRFLVRGRDQQNRLPDAERSLYVPLCCCSA
jgi:hypothetical protein